MGFSIDYVYRIIDKYSPILNKMAAAATKFDRGVTKIQNRLGQFQQRLQTAGRNVANLQTGLAALGAGVYLKKSMDDALEFHRAMNMTSAVTGIVGDDLEYLRNRALDWGAKTQFSSIQVGKAMSEFGKKGLDLQKILSIMPGTMDLAAAGELNLADAASYSTGILNQFGLNLDKAGDLADLLATAASNSATSVRGIAEAMANTGVQADIAGVSVIDTTAALMALAQKQMEGARAGTMMMNLFIRLTTMAPKLRKGFIKLGIDIDKFRDSTTGQITDFFGLIEAMKKGGATAEILGKMFDIRALKAMSILVQTSTEDLEMFREKINVSGGASRKMAETLLSGPVGTMVRFRSVMQNLNVTVGSFLAEAIEPLVIWFTKLVGGLQKNNPGLLKFITYALMGITAVGAFLIPLGLMMSTIGSLIGVVKIIIGLTKLWSAVQMIFNMIMAGNPIALIVLGIIALIAVIILVIKNWEFVKKVFWKVVNSIKAGIKKLWNWFSGLLDNPFFTAVGLLFAPWLIIPALIIKHWDKVKAVFTGIVDKIKAVGGFFKGIFGGKTEITGGITGSEVPLSTSKEVNVSAESSVSVYTEKSMKATPFKKSGNLGYNLVQGVTY